MDKETQFKRKEKSENITPKKRSKKSLKKKKRRETELFQKGWILKSSWVAGDDFLFKK